MFWCIYSTAVAVACVVQPHHLDMLVEVPILNVRHLTLVWSDFALPVETGYGGFLTLYMWDCPQQDYFRISDDRSWLGIALSVSRMSCRELCEVAAHSFGVFSYWSPSWDLSEGLWVFGLASVAMPCSCTRSCREELLLGHLLKYSH